MLEIILIWLVLGFLGGINMTYSDYKSGKDITLNCIFAIFLFTLFGLFTFISSFVYFFDTHGEEILIKGKKK